MLFKVLFPIILQLLGIGVIISEFFIPSGGILSVLSVGLLGYSIYLLFVSVSKAAGFYLIAADLIIVPIIVLYGINVIIKSRMALRSELSSKDGVVSQSDELVQFVGKQGVSVSPLHPSGIALIDGHRVDVVTGGEFITRNTPVEVVSVDANRVIVKIVTGKV